MGNEHDAVPYRKLMKPVVDDWEQLMPDLLSLLGFPKDQILFARCGGVHP
ncbi:MAG TPA: hypothetical protein VF556_13830 [Pyrinomonadaceae bacterium]